MAERRPRIRRLYGMRASRRYRLVLALILCQFFFVAAAPDEQWSRAVLLLLSSATLAIALWTSRSGGVRARMLMVGVASFVAALQLSSNDDTLKSIASGLSGVLVVATIIAIIRGLIGSTEVDQQTVIGAICVYLLAGMLFTFVYSVAAVLGDGAFFSQGTDGNAAIRQYFSFVTLTTVGYGDYTPATAFGRTVANTESLFGQLYLVTVVAVIVGRMTFARRR